MIALYHTLISPYARKVRVLLTELGIEFRPEVLTYGDMEQGPIFPGNYETRTPNLRVPLLQDGPLELFESNVILEYLYETYGKNGKNVEQGARAAGGTPPCAESLTRPERRWEDLKILSTIETLLDSAINYFQMTRFGLPADEHPYLVREAQRVRSCLDWLEGQATAEGFWPGTFSAMELNLVCALDWMDFRKPMEWRGRPRIEAVHARFRERPSLAETLAP